jgi:hypothetical protein
VRKVPFGQASPVFEQRLHGLPDGQHVGVFVGSVEPALDPREDLHVGQAVFGRLEDQGLVVGDEPKVVQGVPVTSKQLKEAVFGVVPDPVGADDGAMRLIVRPTPKYVKTSPESL